MVVALFDDSLTHRFYPLTLTKPSFDLKIGCMSRFEEYINANKLNYGKPSILLTREYLSKITQERHSTCLVNPGCFDSDTIFINGFVSPYFSLKDRIIQSHSFIAILDGKFLIAAKTSKKDSEYVQDCILGGKRIDFKKLSVEEKVELDSSQDITYNKENINNNTIPWIISWPWEIIKFLEPTIMYQLKYLPGNHESNNVNIIGPNKVRAGKNVKIEEGTVFDTTDGDIYIGDGARVSQCRITGPAFIGENTYIKQFSLISKSHIGSNCRIAGEIELSILSDYTNKAHAGFIGHSYAGEWINFGANTTTSDLKMTYGNIKVDYEKTDSDINTESFKINTGINKLGSFFGDMSKTAIGTYIFGGLMVGISSHLFGFVTDNVPSFTISAKGIGAKDTELFLESAIETQKRMMTRRGVFLSESYKKMIQDLFMLTAKSRIQNGVISNKFSL